MNADQISRCNKRIAWLAIISAMLGLIVIGFAGWSYFTGFRGRVFKAESAVSGAMHNALIDLYSGVAFVLLPLLGLLLITIAYSLITGTKPLRGVPKPE